MNVAQKSSGKRFIFLTLLIVLTALLLPVHSFALSVTMQARVRGIWQSELAEAYWGTPIHEDDEFELKLNIDTYGTDSSPEAWDAHYTSSEGLIGTLTVSTATNTRVHTLTEYRLLDNEPVLDRDYLFIRSDTLMGGNWGFYFQDADGSIFDSPLPVDSLGLNGWEMAFINLINPDDNTVIYQSEIIDIQTDAVPEPGTIALFGCGVLGLFGIVLRNRQK